jgi:hypothetical protein
MDDMMLATLNAPGSASAAKSVPLFLRGSMTGLTEAPVQVR